MLRSLRDLERYTVRATDGDVGTVKDFFLDDERWIVRYLVVEAVTFVFARRVLLSPASFGQVDWAAHRFDVALASKAIEDSPDVDTQRPVSRQHADGGDRTPSKTEIHLRSVNEMKGYHVQGIDDAVGHVDDFIVDDWSWEIRYLVIDTRNWWSGKKVLVAPRWASGVSWAERKVHMGLTHQAIKASPEWHPAAPIDRQYEAKLYDHYGRRVYWEATRREPAPMATRPTRPPH